MKFFLHTVPLNDEPCVLSARTSAAIIFNLSLESAKVRSKFKTWNPVQL